jgi:hypothetical protein
MACSGTKKKATALLAGHGLSRPAFKPKIKKGKQNKRCASKDCNNFVKKPFHKFCDACYSSRKEKSSAENDSSALDDVPATVREQNRNKKLMSLKKKLAQISNNGNKTQRAALLQQANALLADMADAPAKKNKKKKIQENQDEEEAGLAELMLNATVIGEQSIPVPKPKPKRTAQNVELDRMLAGCTVQRFAGCSVPSNLALRLSFPLMNAISSIDACIASVCSGLKLSLNDVVFAADLWNLTLDSTAPIGPWDLGLRPTSLPSWFGARFSLIIYLTFLLFLRVLQTLFLQHTNNTFVNHRTQPSLINTSRN